MLTSPNDRQIDFVVGVILSEPTYFNGLISDIMELNNITGSIAAFVVLDNVGLPNDSILESSEQLAMVKIKLNVITIDEAKKIADAGLLGSYYKNERNRKGIAFGRTVLHRCVYLECIKYPCPVAWIIDDDVSLRNIYWGTFDAKISGKELLGHIDRWRKNGISIVVGKVGGDPPVPVMSTARTQMLDLFFNLKAIIAGNPIFFKEREFTDGNDIMKTVPAYFYDFSEKYFGQLETPIWKDLRNTSLEEFSKEARMIPNKAAFRKAVYPIKEKGFGDIFYYQDDENFGPVRGGNTIVLNLDCLRDFTNSSPRSDDIPYRRGDTLWVILNKRLGQRRQIRRARTVISSPLMLVQDRRREESFDQMQEKLISDTLGSAFTRSLDSFLFKKVKGNEVREDYYSFLNFTDSEIKDILNAMEVEIDKRVRQILLNSWRIRGLIQSIQAILTNFAISPLQIHENLAAFRDIVKLCERMEKLFSESEICRIINQVKDFNREDVINFLLHLFQSSRQFADNLPIHYSQEEITSLKASVKKIFHAGDLRIMGIGSEGIVFSDQRNVFKCFHYGRFSIDKETLEFLKEKLLEEKYTRLANLYEIYSDDNHLIFKEEFVNGKTYRGGMVKEFIFLLRECRSTGIVLKNIAPKNILDSGRELRFIDLGHDLEPFTELGFIKMCRKAYLTIRWHFRPDIQDLLRRSNSESDFPELYGFQYFLDLLLDRDPGEISIPFVSSVFFNCSDKKILDFGCGKGQISDELAKDNDVFVYDKDLSAYFKKHPARSSSKVIDRDDLNRISIRKEKFDVILVSLVLCTVSNAEAREILADSRKVLNDNGEIVVVICNPFNVQNMETGTHEKIGCLGSYHDLFSFEKRMKISGNVRREYHRPIDWYIRELKRAGFLPIAFYESDGACYDSISPGSEFLMIKARAVNYSEKSDVSLMIKASPMEWRTISYQIKHIVGQLEGPEKFREKFIITDRASGNFARQYDNADLIVFDQELKKLLDEGVIDFVVYASEDVRTKERISERWFGIKCSNTRSANGQPVLTTLEGFERVRTRYVLQIDSDCIICRNRSQRSYLEEMMDVLKDDKNAVTASFPICNIEKKRFTAGAASVKWRAEVRNCLIDMERLALLRPLPNHLNKEGVLELPWHRALDMKLASGSGDSYRGSTGNACFIHVPNLLKHNLNFWYNAVKHHEESPPGAGQMGRVDLQATEIHEVLEQRHEDMVVVVKGRNVPIPKIRRCFKSLLDQNFQGFGVIYIDVASENGSDEYVQFIGKNLFPGRMTLFRNYIPITSMENIFISIKGICRNPQSIIVLLDADDALVGKDALSKVKSRYDNGADLTVGSMIRTDKYKEYPVDFVNPRVKRGGNVWQHLRTFRKYLFDSICQDDFKINGEWVPEADDWAYMIPMVEMAEHPEVIQDIIYFYEPSPDKSKRDIGRYEETIAKIVAKKSYQRLICG